MDRTPVHEVRRVSAAVARMVQEHLAAETPAERARLAETRRGLAHFVRTGDWPRATPARESTEPARPVTDLDPGELNTALNVPLTAQLEAGWAGFHRHAERAHSGQAGMSLADFTKTWVGPHRQSPPPASD